MSLFKICSCCGEKKPIGKFRNWRTVSGEIHSSDKCIKCYSTESNEKRRQVYETQKRLDFIHSLSDEELINECKTRGIL